MQSTEMISVFFPHSAIASSLEIKHDLVLNRKSPHCRFCTLGLLPVKFQGMTCSALIAALATRFPKPRATDAEIALKEILDAIAHSMARDDHNKVRGSDSLSLNYRAQRSGRNPKTGEKVSVTANYVPHFKPWEKMWERVEPSVKVEKVRLVA